MKYAMYGANRVGKECEEDFFAALDAFLDTHRDMGVGDAKK